MQNNNHIYEELMASQGGKCAECGDELSDRLHTHIDRIKPGADGGKYILENCQLLCLRCDWKKEGNKPNSQYPELAKAYRTYKLWQTERNRLATKIDAFSGDMRGTTRSPYFDAFVVSELVALREHFADLTKDYKKQVAATLGEIPVATELQKGYGAGPLVIAHILQSADIRIADTVSSLWSFFGYTPKDAAGAKGRNPGKGQLRAPIYASLSISLIRKTSPYRHYYDTMRARELSHGAAIQRTIKLWLSHLWETWRRLEGLPVTKPYANNHLGHDGFISAQEFGWPSQNSKVAQ